MQVADTQLQSLIKIAKFRKRSTYKP